MHFANFHTVRTTDYKCREGEGCSSVLFFAEHEFLTFPPLQFILHKGCVGETTIKSKFKMTRRNGLMFLSDFAMILSVLQVRSVLVHYEGIQRLRDDKTIQFL